MRDRSSTGFLCASIAAQFRIEDSHRFEHSFPSKSVMGFIIGND